MQITLMNLLLLFSIIGCSQDNSIYLENKSKVTIDSIVLRGNDLGIKFTNILPNKVLEWNGSINYKHDILMIPYIYINDSAEISEQYFYDDLGFFPRKCKITIDENLKIRWEILSTKNAHN